MVFYIFLVLLNFSHLDSSGFRIPEHSSRANSMGSSFVAIIDDPAVVRYNPASLSLSSNNYLSLGTILISPKATHKYLNDEDKTKSFYTFVPYIYFSNRFSKKTVLGFSYTVPFGLKTEWPDDVITSKIATVSDLVVNDFSLVFSHLLFENISLGAGINYFYVSSAILKSKHSTLPCTINMSADGDGFGYTLSLLYKYSNKTLFGINYNSSVYTKLNGNINCGNYFKNNAWSYIKFPDTFQFGISHIYKRLLFSLTLDYTNWTRYRKLEIYTPSSVFIYPKNWNSVWAYRFGMEYSYKNGIKLRSGFFYDKNPIPERYFETRIPDSNRIGVSIGFGIKEVDISYTYLYFLRRTIKNSVYDDLYGDVLNGKYSSYAHLFALGINYAF